MQFITIILFYITLFFTGRGVYVASTKFFKFRFDENKQIFEIKIVYFYPLFALFALGNFNFLINFFLPINRASTSVFIAVFLIFNLIISSWFKVSYDFLVNFVILMIISVSSSDVGFQYDAGYYHLNFQNWIRSEKIIFGLSNVNTAHALSSISDYISASFWLDGNYILLHYVNLIFIGLFYFVMYKYLFGDNNYFKFSAFGVLIFSFLDNFGVNSGRNGFFAIQGIGKPDIIFGVSFFFCCIYIHCFLRKKISNSEILFTYILTIFSFQLKQFGIVLVFYFLISLYPLLRNNNRYRTLKKYFFTVNFILIFWIIKGFILSGCFFFPLEFTCSNLSWYIPNTAYEYSLETSIFNNAYALDLSFTDWIRSWLNYEINKTVFYNFLLSIFFISTIRLLLFKKTNASRTLKTRDLFFILSTLLIWIFGSPHPRFLFGFLTFLSFTTFNTLGKYKLRIGYLNKFLRTGFIILFIASVVLTPRMNSYKQSSENNFNFTIINEPEVKFKNYYKKWVLPAEGDQCWSNLDCLENYLKIKESIKYSYKIFEVSS